MSGVNLKTAAKESRKRQPQEKERMVKTKMKNPRQKAVMKQQVNFLRWHL